MSNYMSLEYTTCNEVIYVNNIVIEAKRNGKWPVAGGSQADANAFSCHTSHWGATLLDYALDVIFNYQIRNIESLFIQTEQKAVIISVHTYKKRTGSEHCRVGGARRNILNTSKKRPLSRYGLQITAIDRVGAQ